mgnify:CR=1 FL=1
MKQTKIYPECEKMLAVNDKSQTIGEFLDWLGTIKNYTICQFTTDDDESGEEFIPVCESIEKLLAQYFEVDLNKIEKEKRDMLKWMRKMNDK